MPELESILAEKFSFHTLTPPLSRIGLNRLHLTDVKPFTFTDSVLITNEVIIELDKFKNLERLSPVFVRKWTRILCGALCDGQTDSMVRSKVDKVLKLHKSLLNMKKKDELKVFLSKPFIPDSPDSVPRHKTLQCDGCKVLKEAVEVKNCEIEELKREKATLNTETEAKTCVINVQKANITLQVENDRKLYQLTKQLNDSQKYCRFLNEEVENIKKTKLYQRNFSMKKDLSNLAQEKSEIEKELEIEKTKSSELNKSLQESKFKLKNEQTVKSKLKTSLNEEKTKNSELLTMLACDEVKVKIREEGSSHRYSDNIRQTFYALQGEAGVSAGNCSKVVQTVAKHLFDFEICNEQLPCASTSVNFSHEANFTAKHQAVSEILHKQHFTYACDATSRQKTHFLEQHIYLSNGK